MFGSNQNTPSSGFGFGSNTNQGTGAFGTTNTGTTGGSAFGASNTTSAFGGSTFGQRPPNTGLFGSGTTPAFGQPQTNTATTPFGTSGGFGTNTNTTSAFGTPTNTSGGSVLFGAKPTTSGFGTATFGSGTSAFGTPGGFGSTATTATPQSGFGSTSLTFGQQNVTPAPVTGSQNPPYQITSEKEQGQTYSTNFHAISMMPAYRNTSFEELRSADYAQGRRYGTAGAFGAPSTFGGTTTGTTGAFGGFGSTTTNTSAPSVFGQPQTNTGNAFGGGAFGGGTAGGFGTNTNTTNVFGQNTPQQSGFGGTSTSGFGTGTTGGFGTSTSGGFGQPSGTAGFGAAKPSGFAFGSGGFGSNTASTNTGFGANTGTTFGTPSNTTSAFGATPTPQASSWSGLGSGTQQTAGFGASTATQENKQAFGGFGGTTSTQTSPFGGFGQKPATTGFGGFGSGTGGFGTTTTTTPSLGTFGNTTNTAASTAPGFGAAIGGNINTNTSGIFGGSSGSGFFNKPAAQSFTLGGGTGLTGTTGTQGSTFPSSGPGSFGIPVFGAASGSQITTPSGSFGTPQTQQASNQLQQSIASSPYSSNPLFQIGSTSSYGGDASKPIAPIATIVPKEGRDDKTPAILAGFRLTPGGAKSRFSVGGSASPLSGSPFGSRRRDVLGLGTPTKVLLSSTPSSGPGIELTPEAFVVPKKGLKSLEISRTRRDLNITGGDVKGIEAGATEGALIETSKPSTVDPRLEKEAREKERERQEQDARKKSDIEEFKKKPVHTNAATKPADNLPISQQRKATPPQSIASVSSDKTLDINSEEDGAYWTIPSMSNILARRDVHAVPNFVVGRKGYGQVRFSQPVDLSHVRSIPDIPGTIVVFDLKICTVYPDESMKPPVGRGLNVPAIITLEKCWPLSKETRQPILDVENPRFIAHVERLKRQPETEFIDYIADTGSWIFKVKHFSSYSYPEETEV